MEIQVDDKTVTFSNGGMRVFDSRGNLIHSKDSTGLEIWTEYDNNNNKIHCKNSNGYEKWWDSQGNDLDDDGRWYHSKG